MDVSLVVAFYLMVICAAVKNMVLISQNIVNMNSGKYCEAHIMKQFASTSPNQCALMSVAEKLCVAFSHHDS